jgi:5-methylcytosine-specific restriction endonuclease McrA
MADDDKYGTVVEFGDFYENEPILVIEKEGCRSEYKLTRTDDFLSDLEKAREASGLGRLCDHKSTEIRKRISKSGSILVGYQCLHCGRASGKYLNKKERPDTELHPWDEGLEDKAHNGNKEKYIELRMDVIRKHYVLQCIEDNKRSQEYSDYLNSQEWKQKRSLVLKRDNYTCTGCGVARATQVHHLTYKHIYNEFLFELTSLCDECHDRVHSD